MVYLPIHEWLMFMVNVGRYTSPMDGMGYIFQDVIFELFPASDPSVTW